MDSKHSHIFHKRGAKNHEVQKGRKLKELEGWRKKVNGRYLELKGNKCARSHKSGKREKGVVKGRSRENG